MRKINCQILGLLLSAAVIPAAANAEYITDPRFIALDRNHVTVTRIPGLLAYDQVTVKKAMLYRDMTGMCSGAEIRKFPTRGAEHAFLSRLHGVIPMLNSIRARGENANVSYIFEACSFPLYTDHGTRVYMHVYRGDVVIGDPYDYVKRKLVMRLYGQIPTVDILKAREGSSNGVLFYSQDVIMGDAGGIPWNQFFLSTPPNGTIKNAQHWSVLLPKSREDGSKYWIQDVRSYDRAMPSGIYTQVKNFIFNTPGF